MRYALALVIANAFVIAKAFAASSARSVNYCGAKMCGHSNLHTFCQYPAGPSPKCRGYMDAQLTAEEKVRIVARLNRRRSEAASGRLRRLPTAGNMLKLRWVEELAREAQRWADQCRPPHTPDERDACRDLYSTSVGQCVASVVGEAPGLRVESMVDMWYMQNILYKGNVTSYIIPMSNVTYYGDFAQMIWARSYMVGCGRSRFMSEWRGRLRSVERLVCNMAPQGPSQARALWAPAAPAKACPPRSEPDPDLPALCTFQRNLDASSDVDGAMTLEEHVLLSIILEIEDKEPLNYLGSIDEFYLTKLAVVTMDNKVTSPLYDNNNLVRKRDIIDTLGLDDNVVHIDNVIMENDAHEFVNMTRMIMTKEPLDDVPKPVKKANLIGRPKSYNIEDLNDNDSKHTTSQDTNSHEDIPNQDHSMIDRDVYLEYALLDNQEDNTSSLPETTRVLNENITEKHTHSSNIDESNSIHSSSEMINLQISTDFKQYSSPDDVISSKRTALTYDYFANVTRNISENTTVATLRDDDYLTDPETVRELQEALDRMERNLEENRSTPAKVRRELRYTEYMPPELTEHYKSETGRSYVRPDEATMSGLNQNKSTDRGPMLNMVLKYIPYLKPYEKEILGTASSTTSSVSKLSISYVLFSVEFVVLMLSVL